MIGFIQIFKFMMLSFDVSLSIRYSQDMYCQQKNLSMKFQFLSSVEHSEPRIVSVGFKGVSKQSNVFCKKFLSSRHEKKEIEKVD